MNKWVNIKYPRQYHNWIKVQYRCFYKGYLHNLHQDPAYETSNEHFKRVWYKCKSRQHHMFEITNYRFKFISVLSKIMNTGHSNFNMARLRVQHLKKRKRYTINLSLTIYLSVTLRSLCILRPSSKHRDDTTYIKTIIKST